MRKWNHAFLLLAIALAWKWQIVSLLRRYSLKNKLVDRMTKLFSVNLYSCLCLTVFLGKSSVFSSVIFPPFSPAPANSTKLTEPRSLGLLGWREICCISIYRIGEFQFSRVWLAPVTRNILGYSLFCGATGAKINLSDKRSSRTNKYQESDELWLVGVSWEVENYFHAELYLQQNHKNAFEKILERFVNCKQTSY